MLTAVLIRADHFSNYSCICCTDALLSDGDKCPAFHSGTIYNVHINQVCAYACVDSVAIIVANDDFTGNMPIGM